MTSSELENLVRIGQLKREPTNHTELDGLQRSGGARLRDAANVVFQSLPHTLGVDTPVWRLLAKCHGLRNQAEYEGLLEVDERLVDDLVDAAKAVQNALKAATT